MMAVAVAVAAKSKLQLLWWELLLHPSRCWNSWFAKKPWKYPHFLPYTNIHDLSLDQVLHFYWNEEELGTLKQPTTHAVSSADHTSPFAHTASLPTVFTTRLAGNGAPFCSIEDLRELCNAGQSDLAIQAMNLMHQGGTCISKDMVYNVLQGCTKKKDLEAGRQLYSLMISIGLDSIAYLGDHLIRLFTLCGSLLEANEVFQKILKPTSYTWNAIISAHAKLGDSERAIGLYQKMQDGGFKPNRFTFLGALKACGIRRSMGQGRLIHEQIVKCGLESEVTVGSTLIDTYAKCGNLEESHMLFDKLPYRNEVSWNAMIVGYTQNGDNIRAFEMYEKMQQEGIRPNKITFSSILKACGSMQAIDKGRSVHEQLIWSGLESDAVVGSTLIDIYTKCGNLDDGLKVFNELPNGNIILWNAIISGYVQHKKVLPALDLFAKMQQEGVKPDKLTFPCILKACGSLGIIEHGRLIHEQIIRTALEREVVIGNTLIDMYAKCGSLEEGHRVFEELPNRNVVSWSAMIAGYAQNGNAYLALELFKHLQQEGIKPHKVVYSCVLKVCGSIGALGHGRLIHDEILRCGFGSDLVAGNILIDMYAKCGSLEEGHKVFNELQCRDVVSWNAMIAGYAQGDSSVLSALELFLKMLQEDVSPNDVTYSCALKACCSMGAVGQGRLIHNQLVTSELESDGVLGNTLVDMYAKCGSLQEAHKVFDELPNRDVALWNALIAGYAQHGNYKLARQCLEDMLQEGLKPDDRTFTSLLASCSYAGHVEDGHSQFASMKADHGIVPSPEHFNCMVGLLSRDGHLNEAEQLLQTMPVLANGDLWRSLLSVCESYGNLELGRHCLKQAVQQVPDNAAGYILMSNIYADSQMWEDVEQLQELRKCAGAWKKPGKSWVEVNNQVHEFIVGDKTHQHADKIYFKIKRLKRELMDGGYIPNVNLVLQPASNPPQKGRLSDADGRLDNSS